MQLFISHSGKDRECVELVQKRIETAGLRAYLAEYDLAGIGSELTPKIHKAISVSAAVVVVLTENAAGSPIVREEIGFALGLGKLVVPLVTPAVARNPAALGMLSGREYIPFDIDDPQEALSKLTDWMNLFARRQQEGLPPIQQHAGTVGFVTLDAAVEKLVRASLGALVNERGEVDLARLMREVGMALGPQRMPAALEVLQELRSAGVIVTEPVDADLSEVNVVRVGPAQNREVTEPRADPHNRAGAGGGSSP